VSERLHKVLAQHGLGSRREIEKWMLAGRVLLNSRPAQPGDRYAPGDRVSIDGKDVTARLKVVSAPRALIYHKPQGQPISHEGAPTSERKSVMESLPARRGSRWVMVNTMHAGDSGLLLLTSDGRLADALRRRAESIPAVYMVRVLLPFPEFNVESLPTSVVYDEETIEFEAVELVGQRGAESGAEGANRWFRVEARRAHRRAAVRALFESRGLKVSRVIQVEFAGLSLPRDLPRGRSRAVTEQQVAELYALAELPAPPTAREVHEQGAARRKGAGGARRRSAPARRPTGNRRPGR